MKTEKEKKERTVKLHLERLYKLSEDQHSIFTPFELCEEMLDKIPKLNSKMEILIMFNLEFVYILKERFGKENMKNIWFLTPCEKKAFYAESLGIDKNHIRFYSYNNKKIEGIMPKFDVVVGNPPYKRSLHLQMLEMSCLMLKEKGEIIWLHPARWLQDILAPLKKNSDFNKYNNLPFIDFKIISCGYASKIFNNEMTSDLVISYIKNNKNSILNEDKIYELRSIPISFKKLLKTKFTSINDVIEKEKRDNIRVRIKAILPNTSHGIDTEKNRYRLYLKSEIYENGMINGKDWTENLQKNQFSKLKGSPIPLSIKFNSINEARNFIDFTNTNIFQFFIFLTKLDVNVQLKYLPFMVDYSKPWTDQRLQKYFNLTQKEINYMNDTIRTTKL